MKDSGEILVRVLFFSFSFIPSFLSSLTETVALMQVTRNNIVASEGTAHPINISVVKHEYACPTELIKTCRAHL